MPLVLQFAHRLSSTLGEYLKRNTKCSFNYFTSSSAFYPKQLGFLLFSTIPTMSKPEKDSKVTRLQLFARSPYVIKVPKTTQIHYRSTAAKSLPTPLVAISGYATTENVFYCLNVPLLSLRRDSPPESSLTLSVRPRSSVGRVTVDQIRRSWVRFPPRSKDFFFTSCGSLIPFTGANAQWVIRGFN